MTKPIIKWVGGKTQILDFILGHFPDNINEYHEIFVGGGSVLLGVLTELDIKNVYAYDINPVLIHMYKNIQSRPDELYDSIMDRCRVFFSIPTLKGDKSPTTLEDALLSRESMYYWYRKEYNDMTDYESVHTSALFIFLNKTCFRGLYREGPRGFNVPYGNYKNPTIIDRNQLFEVHHLIKNVVFEHVSFEHSIPRSVHSDDFIYLDPPYVPECTSSFTNYTHRVFNHDVLFEECKKIKGRFMMSNSNTEYVVNNFTDYTIIPIECKRRINSKNPESTTVELVVKNFINAEYHI